MILRRLILLSAILSALIVSLGVMVVAAIYALYALLVPQVGAANAAALMFGAVALLLGAASLGLWIVSRGPRRKPSPAPVKTRTESVIDRLAEIVRERPVVVIVAAVGAGILAVRNPRYLGLALRAFATPREADDEA